MICPGGEESTEFFSIGKENTAIHPGGVLKPLKAAPARENTVCRRGRLTRYNHSQAQHLDAPLHAP